MIKEYGEEDSMGFRDKHNNLSGKLFGGFSFKSKVIIFCILSLIVCGIAYKSSIDNRASNKSKIENINQ